MNLSSHARYATRVAVALCGFCIPLANAQSPAPGPASFVRVSITAPTGSLTQAMAINDSARVVGFYFITVGINTIPKPFLWSRRDGVRTLPDIDYGAAASINDCGEVAGSVSTWIDPEEGQAITDAARWTRSGQLQLLKDFATTTLHLQDATDINERGHIVGIAFDAAGQVGYWWPGHGNVVRIPPFEAGGTMIPIALNNFDQVVGVYFSPGGSSQRAFVWSPWSPPRDLGGLGGTEAQARDINDAGRIVGFARIANGSSRPVLWRGTVGPIELQWDGAGAAEVAAINEHGVSVGVGFNNGSNAVGWTRSGTSFLLEAPDAFIVRAAVGINDAGVIVGNEFTTRTDPVVWFPKQPASTGANAALCRHRFGENGSVQ